jgi:hypothetical protein
LQLFLATDEKGNYGSGRYEVVSVEFYYREDRESHRLSPAAPLAIYRAMSSSKREANGKIVEDGVQADKSDRDFSYWEFMGAYWSDQRTVSH